MKDKLKSDYDKNQLSDVAWEKAAQAMLNAKFDAEREQKYETLLSQVGVERNNSSGGKIFNLRKLLTIAASILFVLALGWYTFSGQNNAQQLASKHLEKPFVFDNGRVRGEATVEINRGKAAEAYQNEDYEKALDYFRQIEAEQAANAADYFQLGLSQMYKKEANYQGALNAFEALRKINPEIYNDEINWFSALCHIMLSKEEDAKSYLNKVLESKGSRKQEEAKELLKKLRD